MPPGKEEQIRQVYAKLARLAGELDDRDKSIQLWLAENFHHPQLNLQAKDITVLTLRVLHVIAERGPLNGMAISSATRIPKGSVSKIASRLVSKKLAARQRVSGNKKEIQFRITPLGKELVAANRAFDKRIEKKSTALMKSYSLEELAFLNRVLDDFSKLLG
jgi:DNA-binding MarR family transcriptional regulator